jgi:hypothetical protein
MEVAPFLPKFYPVSSDLENTNEEKILNTILKGLKNLDYYLQMPITTTLCTTINPGTPKNK